MTVTPAPYPDGGSDGTFDARIAGNALWLFVAQAVTLVTGLLVIVTVTRVLGPEDLGRWRFAQAITAILLVLADGGLTGLAIREVARRPDEIGRYAGPVIRIRLILSAVLLAGLVAALAFAETDRASTLIALLVAAGLVPAAFNAAYLFQAREAMGPISRLRTAAQIAGAVAAIVGTLVLGTLFAAVIPFLIASFVVGTVTLIWAIRAGYLTVPGPGRSLVRMAAPAIPFLIAALAVQVIFNADAFIIRALRGEADLGRYAAPYSIAGYTLVIGGAVMTAAYPRIATHAHSSLLVGSLLKDLSAVMGVLAVPLSIGTMLIADELVTALFGGAFAASGPILAILMTLPLVGFLNMTLGQGLTARGLAGPVALVAVTAAVVNVAVNIVLVPSLGGLGAAITVAITEAATAILYLSILWRRDRTFPVPDYFGCLPATVVMAACVLLARFVGHPPLPVTVLVGVVSFLAGSILFPSRGLALLLALSPGIRRTRPKPP